MCARCGFGIQLHARCACCEGDDCSERGPEVSCPCCEREVGADRVDRIDVGGKLLTNYLKELVSFRHWYMMDQTSVIEKVKEDCCYVTERWDVDWELARSVASSLSPSSLLNSPAAQPTPTCRLFAPTSSPTLSLLRPTSSATCECHRRGRRLRLRNRRRSLWRWMTRERARRRRARRRSSCFRWGTSGSRCPRCCSTPRPSVRPFSLVLFLVD